MVGDRDSILIALFVSELVNLNVYGRQDTLSQLIFPSRVINSENFHKLALSDDFQALLFNLVGYLLLPTDLIMRALILVSAKIYEYRPSNSRLLLNLSLVVYFLNILLVPFAFVVFIKQATIIPYVIALFVMLLSVILTNNYRLSNLFSSREGYLLQLDKAMETIVDKEKNFDRQRIQVEALLAIKRVFSTLKLSSFDFSYALFSSMFISFKQEAVMRDPRKERFEALRAETEQTIFFLARSQA